ncbi:hypothetical protein KAZ57_00860 [Patescibacteria group bacterium]|nr:hypothetical protein [Patescibacteria group bacterium]
MLRLSGVPVGATATTYLLSKSDIIPTMTSLSKNNQQLFNTLKSLKLPKGEFIIFGSGAMLIRGLKDGHDLDVFCSSKLFDEYRNREGWKLKPCNQDYYLSKDGIELWETWRPGDWNFYDMVKEAEYIDDLPFVTLEVTKQWKIMNGREKDLEHVKLIDTYLVENSNLETAQA